MGIEIERKFLIKKISDIPFDISGYPFKRIEQGYVCTDPVIRVRQSDDRYILTIKGQGLKSREEHELPLSEESYKMLRDKSDGIIISKLRYLIPLSDVTDHKDDGYSALTIELDIFGGLHQGLILAEIEFDSEELADAFTPPAWLGTDVTDDGRYHNSYLSKNPTPV